MHPEVRLGGSVRDFDLDHLEQYQLMIYPGERMMIGLSVEAHYNAPFVKEWLDRPSFAAVMNDVNVPDEVKKSRKRNLARWALSRALVNEIRRIDNAIQIHSDHVPESDICSNQFLQSEFIMPYCLMKLVKNDQYVCSDSKKNDPDGNFAQSASKLGNRETQPLQKRRKHETLLIPGPKKRRDADMDTLYLSA